MDERIAQVCGEISPPDARVARMSRMRQLTTARPAGSLGDLDEILHRIAAICGYVPSGVLPSVVSVLAADHGVAQQRTSVFRTEVTRRVLDLIRSGHAPVNIMADRVPARVETADFGLRVPLGDERYRVGPGTSDITVTDAMPAAHAVRAVENGIGYARDRLSDAAIVAVGEIGIGNTTASAALAACLLDLPAAALIGPGTGVDEATVARKQAIVETALARTRADRNDPLALLAAVGGYEIAGNVGVILAAGAAHQIVVIDGYITGVAALLAVRMCPTVRHYLIASHQSAEPGHAAVLRALGLRPLLALKMRLGMASGAVLALGLLNTAIAVETATPPARTVGLTGAR